MVTGRAKPIRIIGDPGNQRPDKWGSTVYRLHRFYFSFKPPFPQKKKSSEIFPLQAASPLALV